MDLCIEVKDYKSGALGSSASARQSCDWTASSSGQNSVLQHGCVSAPFVMTSMKYEKSHSCVCVRSGCLIQYIFLFLILGSLERLLFCAKLRYGCVIFKMKICEQKDLTSMSMTKNKSLMWIKTGVKGPSHTLNCVLLEKADFILAENDLLNGVSHSSHPSSLLLKCYWKSESLTASFPRRLMMCLLPDGNDEHIRSGGWTAARFLVISMIIKKAIKPLLLILVTDLPR